MFQKIENGLRHSSSGTVFSSLCLVLLLFSACRSTRTYDGNHLTLKQRVELLEAGQENHQKQLSAWFNQVPWMREKVYFLLDEHITNMYRINRMEDSLNNALGFNFSRLYPRTGKNIREQLDSLMSALKESPFKGWIPLDHCHQPPISTVLPGGIYSRFDSVKKDFVPDTVFHDMGITLNGRPDSTWTHKVDTTNGFIIEGWQSPIHHFTPAERRAYHDAYKKQWKKQHPNEPFEDWDPDTDQPIKKEKEADPEAARYAPDMGLSAFLDGNAIV